MYQVARNGQMYGPYSLEELQKYFASGNVLATDLTKLDSAAEWVPVAQVLGAGGVAPPPPAQGLAPRPGAYAPSVYAPGASGFDPAFANSTYPPPPNLHWAIVLLISFFCGLFPIVWLFVQAGWMRKVQPTSQAIWYYAGAMGAYVLAFPFCFSQKTIFVGVLLFFTFFALIIVGHFSLRTSLLEHFNGPEPIGLQLSPVMTFFFNTLYFQYHLTRIYDLKMAAQYGQFRR